MMTTSDTTTSDTTTSDTTTRVEIYLDRRIDGPLYKYLFAEHAFGLVARGELRITTLHDCQRAELGPEIADPDEGRQDRVVILDDFTVPGDEQSVQTDKERWVMNFVKSGNGQPVRLKNCIIDDSSSVEAPNAYMYCTSRVFDPVAMRRFGYDACVRINDPQTFLGHLTGGLAHFNIVHPRSILRPCEYGPRSGHVAAIPDAPLWCIKSERYKHQQEARMLWDPIASSIEPFLFRLKGIRDYCSLHYVPGMDIPPATIPSAN